jgi:hypothetical protein
MTGFPVLAAALCGVLAFVADVRPARPDHTGVEIARRLTASSLVIVGTPGPARGVFKTDSEERKRVLRELHANQGGVYPLPEIAGWLYDVKVEQALCARTDLSSGGEKDATVLPRVTRVRVFVARDPDREKLGPSADLFWKTDHRYIFFLVAIPRQERTWLPGDPSDSGVYFRLLEGDAGTIEINSANAETVKRISALCEALRAQGLVLKLGLLENLRSTGDTVLDEAAQALIDWLKLSDTGQSVR